MTAKPVRESREFGSKLKFQIQGKSDLNCLRYELFQKTSEMVGWYRGLAYVLCKVKGAG